MEQQYIGVDLHKAFFQACALGGTGERLWEARFPRSAEGVALLRARCTPATYLAVEATGPTWSFVDAVSPTVARRCVVDTRKTRLKAGYAAKTDRLDARRLADARRRESVVSIYVPPPAIRALREVCRTRHHLVRFRSRLGQAIRALLLRSDAGDPPGTKLYAPRALAWLEQVTLPSDAAASLARLRRLLRAVQTEVVAADVTVRERAAADPIACALDGLTGIGSVLALTIRAKVGDISRFPGGPALASYAGLVPRVDSSGGRWYYGRITREGSPWLRWALIEAALHAMRRPDALGPGPGAWRCARAG